jgi:hypothetical protein
MLLRDEHKSTGLDQLGSYPAFDRLGLELHAWFTSFGPGSLSSQPTQPDSSFLQLEMMHVQALSQRLWLDKMANSGVEDTCLLSTSAKIISFSERIATDEGFHRRFCFDDGIIGALFVAFIVCEEQSMMEEAVEILKSIVPRQESV